MQSEVILMNKRSKIKRN